MLVSCGHSLQMASLFASFILRSRIQVLGEFCSMAFIPAYAPTVPAPTQARLIRSLRTGITGELVPVRSRGTERRGELRPQDNERADSARPLEQYLDRYTSLFPFYFACEGGPCTPKAFGNSWCDLARLLRTEVVFFLAVSLDRARRK